MKKLISYVLLFAIVLSVVPFTVFAEEIVETTEFAISAKVDKDEENVVITVTSEEANTDVLIKVVNQNDEIVYVKALLAEDNTGEYKVSILVDDLSKGEYTATATNYKETVTDEFKIATGGGGGNGGGETTTEKVDLDNTATNKNDKILETSAKVDTVTAAKNTIKNMASGVSEEVKADSTTSENAALVTGIMAGNVSSKKVSASKTNKLVINESLIKASDLNKVETTVKAIMDEVNKQGYVYNREIQRELVLKVEFDQKKKATIVISQSVIDALKGIDILTIADETFRISFTVEDLKKELADMEDGQNFEIYIEKVEVEEENPVLTAGKFDFITQEEYAKIALAAKATGSKISFNKEKLVGNANVSVPAQSKSNTQFQSVKNAEDNSLVGGKYNAATGMIDTTIGAGGTYVVAENQVDFKDIADKSAAMQEAIKVLAAKGIIEGTGDSNFSPDAPLSRGEFAKLLVKTLYTNTSGPGFIDTNGKWYESYAKAARGAGIINGFEDGSFRGDLTINKEQIIAVAARTLREKKKYFNPTEPEKYLSSFTDREAISDWAVTDLSLASRENLIILRADGKLNGGQSMTRGEAALVLKRLFDRL